MSTQTTVIDLLRHGECEGGEIFRGSTDVVLTPRGWTQMQAAVAGQRSWDRIHSSSMQRCRLFAEELASQHQLALNVHNELREIHFGDWEGVEQSVIMREQGESLQRFWRDPLRGAPPNGESIIDFQQRVVRCFQREVEAARGQRLLFVVHGAVIRVLMCELLKMPLDAISSIAVPYACFTRFRIHYAGANPPWVQLCVHGAHPGLTPDP